MKEYWEENLHALNKESLVKRLRKISEVFTKLNLPEKYEKDQLYFITDDEFLHIIIGLSREPRKTLSKLQSQYNRNLLLLYYYDPIQEQKKFKKNLPEVKINPRYNTPDEIMDQQIRWLTGKKQISNPNEWHTLDNRALRILVKKGMIYLKELMSSMGLDYSSA
jgi:hypothetical protein